MEEQFAEDFNNALDSISSGNKIKYITVRLKGPVKNVPCTKIRQPLCSFNKNYFAHNRHPKTPPRKSSDKYQSQTKGKGMKRVN